MDTLIKKMTLTEIDDRFGKVEKMMKDLTRSKLTIMDKEYDLSQWITLTDYSKSNNLSVARVQNWIIRGIVPADCILVVPELNHLKLIKNQVYETRATR